MVIKFDMPQIKNNKRLDRMGNGNGWRNPGGLLKIVSGNEIQKTPKGKACEANTPRTHT